MSNTLPPIDRSGLIATRRDFHQHPELGFEETRTSRLVAERLQRLGYDVQSGVGKTGVAALKSGGDGHCVLLRADMDALPVEEANTVPYRSTHPGKMHACGHDGLVARRRNPFEEGVVSVTQLHAGHAFNVIPGRADLRGTVRTFGGAFFEDAPRLIEEAAHGVTAAFGARAEVRYRRLSGPLVNDERMATLVREVAGEIVGDDHVRTGVRTMGGEDMAYFLQQVPGCFAFVGSAPPDGKAS